MNSDIQKTGNKSYVECEEYCNNWFNNFDKNSNLPKKQLFGNFYDFGDEEYLLHVEVATMNLHIGFVKYEKRDGIVKALKMNKNDFSAISKKFHDKFENHLFFEERGWGLKWYTHDCGTIIDLTKAENYTMMMNLEKSDFNKNILQKVLNSLSKK